MSGRANGISLSELYANCNVDELADDFAPERRSIRIHGHSTTIRLEKSFWAVVEQMAAQENLTVAALITSVQDHCPQIDTRNLASCLRVMCLRASRGSSS